MKTYAEIRKQVQIFPIYTGIKAVSLTGVFLHILAKQERADIDNLEPELFKALQLISLVDKKLLGAAFLLHSQQKFISSLYPRMLTENFQAFLQNQLIVAECCLKILGIVPDRTNLENIILAAYENVSVLASPPDYSDCRSINKTNVKKFLANTSYPSPTDKIYESLPPVCTVLSPSECYAYLHSVLPLASASQYVALHNERSFYAPIIKFAFGSGNIDQAFAQIRQRPHLLLLPLYNQQNFLHFIAKNGRTDLFKACSLDIIGKAILGNDVNKKTPIELAAEAQQWEMVEAFPQLETSQAELAHYAQALLLAARADKQIIILDLLKKGAMLTAFTDTYLNIIHLYLKRKNAINFLSQLVESNAEILNSQYSAQYPTPLIFALTENEVSSDHLQWLLNYSHTDLNKTQNNKTPLLLTIEKKEYRKLALLINCARYTELVLTAGEWKILLPQTESQRIYRHDRWEYVYNYSATGMELKKIFYSARMCEIVVATELRANNIKGAAEFLFSIYNENKAIFLQEILEPLLSHNPNYQEQLALELFKLLIPKAIEIKNEALIECLFSLINDKEEALAYQFAKDKATAVHLACSAVLEKSVKLFSPYLRKSLSVANSFDETPILYVKRRRLDALLQYFPECSHPKELYGQALEEAAIENNIPVVSRLIELKADLTFYKGPSCFSSYLKRNDLTILAKLVELDSSIVNQKIDGVIPALFYSLDLSFDTYNWLLQQKDLDINQQHLRKNIIESIIAKRSAKCLTALLQSPKWTEIVVTESNWNTMLLNSRSLPTEIVKELNSSRMLEIVVSTEITRGRIVAAAKLLTNLYKEGKIVELKKLLASLLERLEKFTLQLAEELLSQIFSVTIQNSLATLDENIISILFSLIKDKRSFLAQSISNTYAMHVVCKYKLENSIQLFMPYADLSLTDRQGMTPIEIVVSDNNIHLIEYFPSQTSIAERYDSALVIAAKLNNIRAMQLLLVRKASVRYISPQEGFCALSYCIVNNNCEAAKLLLQRDETIINLQNNPSSSTPLLEALCNPAVTLDTLCWLLQQPGLNWNQTKDGHSPLYFLVKNNEDNAKLSCFLQYAHLLISGQEYKDIIALSKFQYILLTDFFITKLITNHFQVKDIHAVASFICVCHEICERGGAATLAILQKLNIDALSAEKILAQILESALKADNTQLIMYLFSKIENKTQFLKNKYEKNNTALHLACQYKNIDCIKLFMEIDSNAIYAKNNLKQTPVELTDSDSMQLFPQLSKAEAALANYHLAILKAAKNGFYKNVYKLLEKNAPLDAVDTATGMHTFHYCLFSNDLVLLQKFVQHSVINQQFSSSDPTALIVALTRPEVGLRTLEWLLNQPALNVNQAQESWSPFRYAVRAGEEDKLIYLIRHEDVKISKANLDVAKLEAKAKFSIVKLLNSLEVYKKVICYELKRNSPENVSDLLFEAYERKEPSVENLILEIISQIKLSMQLSVTTDFFNDLVLFILEKIFPLAIERGDENLIAEIFNSLSDKNKKDFMAYKEGCALNLACKFGRENTVKLLIDAGADVTVLHKEKTPIQMVADNNHWFLIKHFPCLDATRANQARYAYSLLLAAYNNIPDVVTIADNLLQKGTLQDFRYYGTGIFPIHAALLHNQTGLIDILIKNKKDIANDQHKARATKSDAFPTPICYALQKIEITVETLKHFLVLANASLNLDIQYAGKTAIELSENLVGWLPAKSRVFKCFARLMALLKNIEVSNLQDLDILNNKKFIDDVLVQAKQDGVAGVEKVQVLVDFYEHELKIEAKKEAPLTKLKAPITLNDMYLIFDPFFADMPKSEQSLKGDFRFNLLFKIRQMALECFSGYLNTLQSNAEKKAACIAAKEHAVFFKHRGVAVGRTDALIQLDKLIMQYSAPDITA